jgi:alpha,alpha-trehalose-phosphate synthase [UDP-forming]
MRPYGPVTSACRSGRHICCPAVARRGHLAARRGTVADMRERDLDDELELDAEGLRFWTRDTLRQVVERVLGRKLFVVVSNREPYIHQIEGEDILCRRAVSGVVTALEPVMRVCGGAWVAHGSGAADRDVVDAHDRIAVPPQHPEYILRRLWLSRPDEDGYYYGFANGALWPLCHIAYRRPIFEAGDWDAYVRVNRQFADAVLDEVHGNDAIVLIQDYHLALLSSFLRAADPRLLIAQFWHIPWPNREVFRICPWAEQILKGLLANDLLGFHIRYHCQNFLETVASSVEARVDYEQSAIACGGHITEVRPFPISLDIDAISEQAMTDTTTRSMSEIRHQLGLTNQRVVLGIDRVDYTKGIPERLHAIDRLLKQHPEYVGKLRFVQIAAPSRTRLPSYQALGKEIEALVEDINWRYGQARWMPILYRKGHHTFEELLAYYRIADVCAATSLHDGMNLVAKEYVAARADGDGVLLLSQFAGAARELEESVQINPYATDETAEAFHQALCMDEPERRTRMAALRATVARNNIYRWAGKMVSELGRIAARRTLETAA